MENEDTLWYWAGRYRLAIANVEQHPEDPYGDAEVEYCEDNMRRHLNKENT